MEGDNDKDNWSGMVGLVGLSEPKYVGGDEEESAGAPLIIVNYKDTVYFKVKTLGVWLWKPNDSFRVRLAAIPRQGIDADDVPSSVGGLSRVPHHRPKTALKKVEHKIAVSKFVCAQS